MRERESDEAMRAAIVRHYDILSAVVDLHGGVRPQEQGEGDSIVAAFARPSNALAAATAGQIALAAEAGVAVIVNGRSTEAEFTPAGSISFKAMVSSEKSQ